MARRTSRRPSGEDRLIARHFKPLARHPGAYGLVDDAAVFGAPPGHELVLKADAIVGGVHFFDDDPPEAVAHKALRVNLSDLAAKGARPAGFLLSLALPKSAGEAWLKAFARGLGADVKRFACPLMGGDTVYTPGPVMVSVAALGIVPKGTMVRRAGAKAGDVVVVTGTIGDAALGLKIRTDRGAAKRWGLDASMRGHLARRYLVPEPRNALAEALRTHASAGMDVSDGLAGDLGKLVEASGVAAEVEAARVPLSAAARVALKAERRLIETILTGGDDFEVVATIPRRNLASFLKAAKRAHVPVTQIGRIVAGTGARFHDAKGRRLTFKRASFSHF